jgi:hypothetical protein
VRKKLPNESFFSMSLQAISSKCGITKQSLRGYFLKGFEKGNKINMGRRIFYRWPSIDLLFKVVGQLLLGKFSVVNRELQKIVVCSNFAILQY